MVRAVWLRVCVFECGVCGVFALCCFVLVRFIVVCIMCVGVDVCCSELFVVCALCCACSLCVTMRGCVRCVVSWCGVLCCRVLCLFCAPRVDVCICVCVLCVGGMLVCV